MDVVWNELVKVSCLTLKVKYSLQFKVLIEMEKEIAHPYLLLSQQQLIYRYHLI